MRHCPSVDDFLEESEYAESVDDGMGLDTDLTDVDTMTSNLKTFDAVLHPTLDNSWTPTQDYEELDVGAQCVTFVGRIVNLYNQLTPSKAPKAAKGCIKLIVADDAGALTHFHELRNLLPPFRKLLARLSKSSEEGTDSFLTVLGQLNLVDPTRVKFLVATAADGNMDEILSPPSHLRRIWKPCARERLAPEDGTLPGEFTAYLWRTTLRVKEVCMPPISEAEVQLVFGSDATLVSHANRRVPYDCGANKYRLVEENPIVSSCTSHVVGGAEEKLPEVQFAIAALLLNGSYHSLIEVMAVFAPLVGCAELGSLEEMIDQLVPRELEMILMGNLYIVRPNRFRDELAARIGALAT
ncbi:uncharacterized protein BDZ99DRAFT_567896 [Mytilinidion resinicola]|uniref:Uncharacterized protein n=1 Tax=Mytilinidion resinicola TaxID=574789 RepID=A0A6A6Z1S0_9PEZI|nr:uncharacterized protein BDZ99DRAFT_567896 [Mytilinidion resinicola]KAF2814234.1 hypothetical protein BDZ99DRAFT_567896 [Mytilinidion resinicola]